MFELAPDYYVLTDLESIIREANRAVVALLSVRQGFLVGESLLLFVDEAERAALAARLAPWRSAGRVQTDRLPGILRGRTQLRVHKGATFPAEYTISPARDGHDQIIGLRWVLRDLSESLQALHALQESEHHYYTLFNNAGDAIFIHNLTGRFLEVNRVACESLGYTRDELLQMTPADLTVPDRVEQIPALVAKLRQEDHIFFEMVLTRRDGTVFPVELSSRLIDYAGGPAALAIARDIAATGATVVVGELPVTMTAVDRESALGRYLQHVISRNRYLQLQGIRSGGKLVSIELDQIYVTLRATDERDVVIRRAYSSRAACSVASADA